MSIGGVIHTYQKYDPQRIPPPRTPGPDLISPVMEHLLMFGDLRELTDEELAQAVRLDPSQIAGLGPSLEALLAMLRERKRKILEHYTISEVRGEAERRFRQAAEAIRPPVRDRQAFQEATRTEQLHDLEQIWYRQRNDQSPFARQLLQLMEHLADKYQIDELASRYEFVGSTSPTIPEALEIKAELNQIDELIKQLEQAQKDARLGVIDMSALAEFTSAEEMQKLSDLQRQIEAYLRELAEQQGLRRDRGSYQIAPKALRLFQGKLLERIFADLQASRTGRHAGPVVGDGAVELPRVRPYEFGDSPTHMDVPQSFINALIRQGGRLPLDLRTEDIEIHETRNSPKCATTVIMDMSGSMRYDALYVHVKRMALALEGLIRREYPGDFLRFLEMYTFARLRSPGEIPALLPKPVTLSRPIIRLKVDMSRPDISEPLVHPHFTNIQHSLRLARQLLVAQDTPNRQVILITDGLPTAHFDGHWLYLLYPPDRLTEHATLREAALCRREGITLNVFLLTTWFQSREDIQFAYRLAKAAQGRVFFPAGRELDRFVVWDYLNRKREVLK